MLPALDRPVYHLHCSHTRIKDTQVRCKPVHRAFSLLATMSGPAAEFISDVDKYMGGQVFESKILELQDQLRSYKQREQQLMMRKARLLQRLPEIKMALEAVLGLLEKRDSDDIIYTDFELTDNVYAKAALQHVDSVNLWLGANVMVEYSLDEAKQLLQQNLDGCKESLAVVEKDMHAVKDNITITEVSMARVFNWDVEQRRKVKAAGKIAA